MAEKSQLTSDQISENKEEHEKKTGDKLQQEAEEEKKEKQKDRIKALKERMKKRDAQIKFLKKQLDTYKDQYLRKLADMENLRKRLEREKTEFYQYALSEFLKELFNILDNFERALQSEDQGNGKSFREGMEMIYRQSRDLLMKQGVTPIEAEGKKFDPHFHQAFIIEESDDVEEPEIIEELQKGYILHNRLIRPSLVKVAVPKKGK